MEQQQGEVAVIITRYKSIECSRLLGTQTTMGNNDQKNLESKTSKCCRSVCSTPPDWVFPCGGSGDDTGPWNWARGCNLWSDFLFSYAKAPTSQLQHLGLLCFVLRPGTAGGLGWQQGCSIFPGKVKNWKIRLKISSPASGTGVAHGNCGQNYVANCSKSPGKYKRKQTGASSVLCCLSFPCENERDRLCMSVLKLLKGPWLLRLKNLGKTPRSSSGPWTLK